MQTQMTLLPLQNSLPGPAPGCMVSVAQMSAQMTPIKSQPACSCSYASSQAMASPARLQVRRSVLVRMGIRALESFDASFKLDEEASTKLKELLCSDIFCRQVAREWGRPDGTDVRFADMLFQPVPWSPTTKKGMPQEYEKFHADDSYTIINVPPNFMFQAKIFQPSRLCAIYKQE